VCTITQQLNSFGQRSDRSVDLPYIARGGEKDTEKKTKRAYNSAWVKVFVMHHRQKEAGANRENVAYLPKQVPWLPNFLNPPTLSRTPQIHTRRSVEAQFLTLPQQDHVHSSLRDTPRSAAFHPRPYTQTGNQSPRLLQASTPAGEIRVSSTRGVASQVPTVVPHRSSGWGMVSLSTGMLRGHEDR